MGDDIPWVLSEIKFLPGCEPGNLKLSATKIQGWAGIGWTFPLEKAEIFYLERKGL